MHALCRVFAVALCCASSLGYATGAASAAELRISFTELAGIVQAVLGDAKLHLHNKPASIFALTDGSHLAFAGKEIAVPLQPKSFNVLGSSYAYFVDDLNSQSIRVSPIASAVRLTLNFDSKADNLVGGCVSGDCSLAGALPKILWKDGTVAIDVAPVHFGSSISLQVKHVSIGGPLSARCDGSGSLFSNSACRIALGFANRTITRLKPDIAAMIQDKVNNAETQTKVAEGLKKYLVVGTAGELAVTRVTSDAKAVTIGFELANPAGG